MSESRIATVVVEDAHVVYEVYEDRSTGLKHLFASGRVRRQARRIHAVRGVSFEVYEGETLGIIGSNGSGKSSLLAAMTGLLPLDSGDIRVRSRPALLGVAAALRASLSGRRNILIGCLALGLAPGDIEERTDEIIDFAGLREFIDLPMRTYSSGMRARLNFAIATASTPSILLIDEALAVGDDEFRQRSQRRIDEIRGSAGSVVLVSHNLSEVEKTCDRVIWLERGELRAEGAPAAVVADYLSARALAESGPATPVLDDVASPTVRSTEPALPDPVRGRRALLHIGVPTAGDERLQLDLHARRGELFSAGFLYPSFLGSHDHNRVAAYGSSEIAARLAVCSTGEWDHWCDGFRRSFLNATADGGDLVLTSLDFSRLDHSGIARVTALLAEAGFDTTDVVVFVRRQDEVAALTHLRRVMRGGVDPFDIDDALCNPGRYDLDALISSWETSPGVGDVHVRLHRDRESIPSAEAALAAIAGHPLPPRVDYQPDRGLSPTQLAMLRTLNHRVEGPNQAWLLARLAEPAPPSLSSNDAERLLRAHEAGNARVLARVSESRRIDDYFAAPQASGSPEAAFDVDDVMIFAVQLADHVALLNRQIRRLGRET